MVLISLFTFNERAKLGKLFLLPFIVLACIFDYLQSLCSGGFSDKGWENYVRFIGVIFFICLCGGSESSSESSSCCGSNRSQGLLCQLLPTRKLSTDLMREGTLRNAVARADG